MRPNAGYAGASRPDLIAIFSPPSSASARTLRFVNVLDLVHRDAVRLVPHAAFTIAYLRVLEAVRRRGLLRMYVDDLTRCDEPCAPDGSRASTRRRSRLRTFESPFSFCWSSPRSPSSDGGSPEADERRSGVSWGVVRRLS